MRGFIVFILDVIVLIALFMALLWFFAGVHPSQSYAYLMNKVGSWTQVVSSGARDVVDSSQTVGHVDQKRINLADERMKRAEQ